MLSGSTRSSWHAVQYQQLILRGNWRGTGGALVPPRAPPVLKLGGHVPLRPPVSGAPVYM